MKTAVFKYAEQHSVAVKSTLEFIMHEALLVTWRQLNDFLSNRKYGSALPARIEAPSSTTADQLIGKNKFGEMDMSQKRNCLFHHLS